MAQIPNIHNQNKEGVGQGPNISSVKSGISTPLTSKIGDNLNKLGKTIQKQALKVAKEKTENTRRLYKLEAQRAKQEYMQAMNPVWYETMNNNNLSNPHDYWLGEHKKIVDQIQQKYNIDPSGKTERDLQIITSVAEAENANRLMLFQQIGPLERQKTVQSIRQLNGQEIDRFRSDVTQEDTIGEVTENIDQSNLRASEKIAEKKVVGKAFNNAYLNEALNLDSMTHLLHAAEAGIETLYKPGPQGAKIATSALESAIAYQREIVKREYKEWFTKYANANGWDANEESIGLRRIDSYFNNFRPKVLADRQKEKSNDPIKQKAKKVAAVQVPRMVFQNKPTDKTSHALSVQKTLSMEVAHGANPATRLRNMRDNVFEIFKADSNTFQKGAALLWLAGTEGVDWTKDTVLGLFPFLSSKQAEKLDIISTHEVQTIMNKNPLTPEEVELYTSIKDGSRQASEDEMKWVKEIDKVMKVSQSDEGYDFRYKTLLMGLAYEDNHVVLNRLKAFASADDFREYNALLSGANQQVELNKINTARDIVEYVDKNDLKPLDRAHLVKLIDKMAAEDKITESKRGQLLRYIDERSMTFLDRGEKKQFDEVRQNYENAVDDMLGLSSRFEDETFHKRSVAKAHKKKWQLMQAFDSYAQTLSGRYSKGKGYISRKTGKEVPYKHSFVDNMRYHANGIIDSINKTGKFGRIEVEKHIEYRRPVDKYNNATKKFKSGDFTIKEYMDRVKRIDDAGDLGAPQRKEFQQITKDYFRKQKKQGKK